MGVKDTLLTQEEITEMVLEGKITIEHVIDAVVDANAIIGVGLISLGNHLKEYIYHHPVNRVSKKLEYGKRD